MNQLFSFKIIRLTSFGFLIFFNLMMGVFFYVKLDHLYQQVSSPIESERPFLSDIIDTQTLTTSLDLHLHKQIAGDIVDNEETLEIIAMIFKKLKSLANQNIIKAEEKEQLLNFTKNLKKLQFALIYYKKNQTYDAASSSSEELYEIIDETLTDINKNLNETISIIQRQINESDVAVLGKVKFIQQTLIIVFFIVASISLFVLFLFNKSLATNLQVLIQGTSMLGQGNLEWRIKSNFDDEFGKLSNAFDSMSQKLSETNQQLLQQTKKIKKLAYYDSLTELANRTTFITRLQQEIERASRVKENLSILFVDLDDFKLTNDIYGHDVGDLLLKQVAERMTRQARLSDIVARFGGDEFTLLLTQQPSSIESSLVGLRILNELNRPFHILGKEISISSSIGVAIYPENGTKAQELLKNADMAMYVAKSEGKNIIKYCSQEMADRVNKMFQTEIDLRKAMVNDELILHYQPQVDLKNKQLSGLEALIRWVHPQKGFVPPMDFIPLAEERGLIYEITKWVLKTACRQQQAWKSAGYSIVPIMINLSAKDFFQPDLEKDIKDILAQERIDPTLIGIEVTETSVMKDKRVAIETLTQIKKMGIKVALDDFGTGYSSLNYLKLLPIDVVKIDRSFVRDIQSDSQNEVITSAIVAMAHALNLTVLAEGVETDEQLEIIEKIQCDFVQGYLFSKPVAAEEISPMLQRVG